VSGGAVGGRGQSGRGDQVAAAAAMTEVRQQRRKREREMREGSALGRARVGVKAATARGTTGISRPASSVACRCGVSCRAI
jgi:hypothetical protein